MREIKFRGKTKSGDWFYGDLFFGNEPWITFWVEHEFDGIYRAEHEVIPETIGQYTGLKDSSGVEIYEGDVVKNPVGERGLITWSDGGFEIHYLDEPAKDYLRTYIDQDKDYNSLDTTKLEVIGNIHDKN